METVNETLLMRSVSNGVLECAILFLNPYPWNPHWSQYKKTWLKRHILVPVAAAAVVLGVPCSISLVAQWLYGWPNAPGYRKYIEALKPRRIYCLTKAVLEKLKYLQYGKLCIQWKAWYKHIDNKKHFEKGIVFGRRGNKLDLYYSPTSETCCGDARAPLVVFVYGGTWGSGYRAMYCLLARHMAQELSTTVICPDYCTYPQGNVLGMVQDIADCLLWARDHGQQFNFDKDNIVLIGHSAGAHLCALTTLFLTGAREELVIDASRQQEIALAIRRVIGLSGVYDTVDHYQHERMRAVEYVSTMHKAMNGVENLPYYSPTHVLKTLGQDQMERLPTFALLHGTTDITVPVESSVKFAEMLTSLSIKVSLYLLPNVDHAEIVTDLMLTDRKFYHTIYSCIKQEFGKLVRARRSEE